MPPGTPKSIAVDLDGVLYDFVGAMLHRLRLKWGVYCTPDQIKEYNLTRSLKHILEERIPEDLHREEVYQDLLNQLYDPDFYVGVKPFDNAYHTVMSLKRFGRVVALTSRPYHTRAITNIAIRRDFGKAIEDVYLSEKKYRVAKRENVFLAVEDSVTHAENYAKHGITCFLLKSPYTEEYRPTKYIVEVKSLSEMTRMLEAQYFQRC